MNTFVPLNGSAQPRPWLFLGLTLGITWLLQVSLIAFGDVPLWLALLPNLAPMGVALWLLYRHHDAAYRRDYWQRVFDFRRIGFWWLVILFFHPLRLLLGASLDAAAGSTGITLGATQLSAQPFLIVPMLVFWLLFGPIPEELGWRGYALDGLQTRLSALNASLVLGVIWALWHLPLYFIAGTFQAEQVGVLTPRFWIFMLGIVVEAVLYTWIYNNTGRSTLSAIMFHFVGNAFGESFALSQQGELYGLGIMVVFAVAVVLIWKPATLTRVKQTCHHNGVVKGD